MPKGLCGFQKGHKDFRTPKGLEFARKHLRKLGKLSKGKTLSETTKKRISKKKKGTPAWNKGKKLGFIPKGAFKKGQIPWNYKGGLPICLDCGRKLASYKAQRCIKCGHKIAWNKGKKSLIPPEQHYNWKGGITPENQKIRASLEVKLWRKAVFERDNFTCQKCGSSKSGGLVAHHIRNFAEELGLRTSIENGITFCRVCHKEFHKKYSNKNNTREQMEDYFNQMK